MKLRTSLLTALSIALTLSIFPAVASADELLVGFHPGARHQNALTAIGGKTVRTIPALGTHVVQVPDAAAATRILGRLPAVRYVEPNKTLRVTATPNDPSFAGMYGLAKISAPAAWDLAGVGAFPATASPVKVGIVDTGIRADHEDLAGQVVDCAGWRRSGSLLFSSTTFTEGFCNDDNGHGTHVAGTVAARTNNGRGVAGVAFTARLSICKALQANGSGNTDQIARCITWLADRGVKVINLSLGGGGTTTLHNAVKYAVAKDALVIAAAGNNGNSTLSYPAGYPEAVSVAATDSADRKASFSNFNAKVELAAPGVNILSTTYTSTTSYGQLSGTSMAAPHVAGGAALLRIARPTLTQADVRSRLAATVDDLGAAGRDTSFGFGRINLARALS